MGQGRSDRSLEVIQISIWIQDFLK